MPAFAVGQAVSAMAAQNVGAGKWGRVNEDAVWWSFPISSALAAFLAALYFRLGGWRSARMMSGALSAQASRGA